MDGNTDLMDGMEMEHGFYGLDRSGWIISDMD